MPDFLRGVALCGLIAVTAPVRAEPQVVRIGTVVPEGTGWAREWDNFANEVERASSGQVHIKTYWGGVTGDDVQSLSWVQRGRLDGVASAGMLCEQLAPSMRVLRLLGVYRSPDESRYVREKLMPVFDQEFRRSGYVNLGLSGVGGAFLFSRGPIHNLTEMKKAHIWVWDIDQLARQYADAIAVTPVRLPIVDVKLALETFKIDGVISVPSAALAYQWLPRLKYYVDMPLAYLTACLVVDLHVWNGLTPEAQATMRAAAAKLSDRLEAVERRDDAKLLQRAMKEGLEALVPTEAAKQELFECYLKAREKLGDQLVPAELIRRAIALLQTYRTQRPK
jgi:TRAP-type C4-dicarboxylate transport system substrate-binding protein